MAPEHTGRGDQEQRRATYFKPNRFSACELTSAFHDVVKSKLRIPHNLPKDTFAQIAFAMDGDKRRVGRSPSYSAVRKLIIAH
jgi:hypothetical protein